MQSWSLSLLRLEEGKARYWRDIEHVLRLSPPQQTGKVKSDNLDIKSYHSSFSFFSHVLDNLKNLNNRKWLWITPDIGTPHGISIIFFLSSTLFSRDTLIFVTAGVGSVGNVGNDSNLLSYLLTSNIKNGYWGIFWTNFLRFLLIIAKFNSWIVTMNKKVTGVHAKKGTIKLTVSHVDHFCFL